MAQLKNNSGRARTAIIAMSFFFGISIISILVELSQYNLLGRIEAGDFTMEEVENSDLVMSSVAILNIIINVTSIVFFIMWFRRAYYNLSQVSAEAASFGEGWAAGAWFVPILNLFRPFQIMKEIWYGTQANSGSEEEQQPGMILGFWWTFWVVGGFLSNASMRMTFGDPEIEQLRTSALLSIASGIVHIVAFILILMIIRKVSGFEKTMFENRNEIDIAEHLIANPNS